MRGRKGTYGETAAEPFDSLYLRDDFELDDLDDEEIISVYDVDAVLGYTVDIFKVGFPFLFLVALFLSMILVFGTYF